MVDNGFIVGSLSLVGTFLSEDELGLWASHFQAPLILQKCKPPRSGTF
jgi:hypothetical protein